MSSGSVTLPSTSGGAGTVTSVDVSGGATGLTTSGGPVTTAGTITLGGTLAVASGGTGQVTANAALNALLPVQSTHSGEVLTTNGTNTAWAAGGTGSVTSIDVSGGTTGLTTSGGPVTTSGVVTIAGTLGIANGGSGQTSANSALNAFLPSQATHNGQILMTDGANTTWASVGGSGTVTSVDVDGGATGLTFSGGPITAAGTITMAGTLVIESGGTNSTTTLNNDRIMQSSAGAIVEAAAITAFRALESDAAGIPIASATTGTELGYVSGVTSSIQTQLDGKQATLTLGDLTDAGTDGITVTGGTGAVVGSGTSLSQHVADASHNGYLSSADFTSFASKQAAGNYITSLTSDVTASGPGAAAATIANNVVTNAKLAQMAAHTYKGNNTGSTANAADVTSTQLTADLDQFTSLLQGVVPASGGGTTNFLRADGSWAVAGSGTVTSVSVTTANGVSGSVATATTTPAITLTLGAIVPSSVAASGTVTGSNLSGTNTGDQTITLTSDVTGSGTGSFATTLKTNYKLRAVSNSFDGGGQPLVAGKVIYLANVPYSGTITGVQMLADVSGSAVVDIWKVAYASAPPSVSNTITASALPTLSAAQKYQDTTLTGWTTTVTAGDTMAFKLNSSSTITQLSLVLTVQTN